jgi:hypothetical protein
MKESWKAETPVEDRVAVVPCIINLKETSEEESHLDDWPVTLE